MYYRRATSCNTLKTNKVLHVVTRKVTQHQRPAPASGPSALVMAHICNLTKQEHLDKLPHKLDEQPLPLTSPTTQE